MKTKSAHNSPRVLGIVGSPRVGGNTDILVDEVLAGALAEGGVTEKAYLGEINISSCRGCEACATAEQCVVEDDMPHILSKMASTDIWVLGTPIYFWGPTGWFKSFVDRWHGGKYVVDFKSKNAILVIPFESKKKATARFATGMLQETLEYLGTTVTKIVLAPGVLARGDVRSHTEVMLEAHQAGQDGVNTWKVQGRGI